jgi:hypothetical protein
MPPTGGQRNIRRGLNRVFMAAWLLWTLWCVIALPLGDYRAQQNAQTLQSFLKEMWTNPQNLAGAAVLVIVAPVLLYAVLWSSFVLSAWVLRGFRGEA